MQDVELKLRQNENCIERILIFIQLQCLPTLFYRDIPNNITNMMVYICHIQI